MWTLTLDPTAPEEAPRWLQQPAVGPAGVVFAYGGDLWRVPLGGGEAVRLTAGEGLELGPVLSPDGRQCAFTGEYDGNVDVYVLPVSGGLPRRLTYHPEVDVALGFSPDGRRVLFRSNRETHARFDRLYSLPLEGGVLPEALPLPAGEQAAWSPDGKRLAYVPAWHRRTEIDRHVAWKGYRGGRTAAIWLAELATSRVESIPREDSVDTDPVWLGERLYFLSDRGGRTGLYSYEPRTRQVTREVDPGDADILSASAGAGLIAYAQLGALYLYDPAKRQSRPLRVHLQGDLPATRPRLATLAKDVRVARLSPTGKRVAFEARGELLTLPAEKGDARNLTRSPGVAERDPAWSPDGRWIAGFSDASGEYALHLWPQDGRGGPRVIPLGEPPSFFYGPRWSPDSRRIAFHDKRLQLWVVEVPAGKPVLVDRDSYELWERTLDPAWSPDGKFLVYTKQGTNHLRALWAWSVEQRRAQALTDGRSDARFAAFDRAGKLLWFTASTDAGPALAWLDLSSGPRQVTRAVYVAVLDPDTPSPLGPQSDEEMPADDQDKAKGAGQGKDSPKDAPEEAVTVRLVAAGLDQRILALPIPARQYAGLLPGVAGELYLLELDPADTPDGPTFIVWRFELEKRKPERVLEGVKAFELSADGKHMLYQKGAAWFVAEAGKAPAPEVKPLALERLEAWVDPRAEWRQMFREVWRLERDFFYDPGLHGLDWQRTAARYAPFVDGLGSRHDLNLLFTDLLGELRVGHVYIEAGDRPAPRRIPGGLLGADYALQDGRWRIARVYEGENWNPALRAPLTQPGAQARAGEYLLEVEGRALTDRDNLYARLEGRAGRAVRLRVGPDPRGRGAREVSVVPVDSERQLRHRAWVQQNRRRVAELSGGRLGYVYLPNTAQEGLAAFDREYFAEVGKAGLVLDERYNGGGLVADYVVYGLRRETLSWCATREGRDFPTPMMAVPGPMAMIINEYAGSGGDALPYMFRRLGLGPLVGTRTWGGLVGIYDYPSLLDGGWVSAPRVGFYSPEGRWEVENRGVAPDLEVPLDPAAWRAGRDPQLERAVAEVLKALAAKPAAPPRRPPYPRPR